MWDITTWDNLALHLAIPALFGALLLLIVGMHKHLTEGNVRTGFGLCVLLLLAAIVVVGHHIYVDIPVSSENSLVGYIFAGLGVLAFLCGCAAIGIDKSRSTKDEHGYTMGSNPSLVGAGFAFVIFGVILILAGVFIPHLVVWATQVH